MKTIDLTSYTCRPGMHEKTAVIWVQFQYDKSKIEQIKSLKGRWRSTYKCWYLPDNRYFRSLLNIPIETSGKSVLAKLSPVNAGQLQRMKELLQMKANSQSTIKTYLVEFAQLLYTLKETPVESLHMTGYGRIFFIKHEERKKAIILQQPTKINTRAGSKNAKKERNYSFTFTSRRNTNIHAKNGTHSRY